LKAVTTKLGWAWHEVATMERLFPVLPGFDQYKETLRDITKRSNALLLQVVEDLSYRFSDNRPLAWAPAVVEQARKGFLDELLKERDAFVYGNEQILIDTLEQGGGLTFVDDPPLELTPEKILLDTSTSIN